LRVGQLQGIALLEFQMGRVERLIYLSYVMLIQAIDKITEIIIKNIAHLPFSF